jgi:hypothetical protein
VREFPGGGHQLWGDQFEHGKEDKGARSRKPEGFDLGLGFYIS